MRTSLLVIALAAVALAATFALTAPAGPQHTAAKAPVGIHKIKHVVVIMQENRSFDHYFGTYPGADGFPRTAAGEFAVCVPDPAKGDCEKPYHDTSDLNAGGPHGALNASADIAGGRMDGFIAQAEFGRRTGCIKNPNDPLCSRRAENPDVMGYHDGQTSRTTGRTRATSSCRTTCSSRTRRGASRRTCSWSRSGPRAAHAKATR